MARNNKREMMPRSLLHFAHQEDQFDPFKAAAG